MGKFSKYIDKNSVDNQIIRHFFCFGIGFGILEIPVFNLSPPKAVYCKIVIFFKK